VWGNGKVNDGTVCVDAVGWLVGRQGWSISVGFCEWRRIVFYVSLQRAVVTDQSLLCDLSVSSVCADARSSTPLFVFVYVCVFLASGCCCCVVLCLFWCWIVCLPLLVCIVVIS